MRKAIQLLHVPAQHVHDMKTDGTAVYPSALVALCDDGTIWSLPLGITQWCQAYAIPQGSLEVRPPDSEVTDDE